MKKIKILILLFVTTISVTSCYDDLDDNIIVSTNVEISDFVWKAMNAVYLYKSEIPDLADDRFVTNEEYNDYLNSYSTPEELFESLKYAPNTIDRFSRIYSDYNQLLDLIGGTSLSNGIEYNLYFIPGSDSEIFGAITQVLNNSMASDLGLERGQIFRTVNGENLTSNNYIELLSANDYTLGFADYNTNGTNNTEDDTVTLNDENVSLSLVTYTENPIHKSEVLQVNGTNIGYLMYNAFNTNYNSALNEVFGEFSAAGVTELVLDLRYNGGGSVQTAAYLGSMVTGQFTGDVYSKLFYNDNLSNNNEDYLFTNSISGSGTINSLNLTKVYVLTTNRRTASASELIINSLRPYIEVIVIGENTVGKTQASRTVYDSPSLFSSDGINLGHTYAMQPLIANSTNVNDELVPNTGLTPDIELSETPTNYGILGDVNEPLLAAAIQHMTSADRSSITNSNVNELIDVKHIKTTLEQDMYID
ncbi:peptidase S41 [Winogradskyella eckloniae]|uniref:S41 family peptidase n=1 Tax=Winogradskyella eckloniae TaxID=1089306 RepID=UPI001564ED2C|nr:S41 family peptidase [Winogradskyella eckloniae]NRD19774.1 peptidase S41 [Winogradskyella eckloniae]